MSASHKNHKWLVFILVFWLLLNIAREAFDLIGKLWIPVAIDLLQVGSRQNHPLFHPPRPNDS